MGGKEVVADALRDLRVRIANLDAGKPVATPAARYAHLSPDVKASTTAVDSTVTSSHANNGSDASVAESRSPRNDGRTTGGKDATKAVENTGVPVPDVTKVPLTASVSSTVIGSSASAGNIAQSTSSSVAATLPHLGTATTADVDSSKAETTKLSPSVEISSNSAQQMASHVLPVSSMNSSSQNGSAELLHLKTPSKHALDHHSHDSPISKRPRHSRSRDRGTSRDRDRRISSHEREKEHPTHEYSVPSSSSSYSSSSSSSSRRDVSSRKSSSHRSDRADRHHSSDASSRSGKSRHSSDRESSASKPKSKHKHSTRSSGGSIIPKEYRNADPREFKAFRLEVFLLIAYLSAHRLMQ